MIRILSIIIAIYLLFAFLRIMYQIALGLLYVRSAVTSSDDRPLVSVIIPAWNEEVGVAKTVRSVMANTYKNIEIIVVDDGSTDHTADAVRRVVDDYPRRRHSLIRLISQLNAGKAGALNTGIDAASGRYVLTLDADSYLMPQSIELLEQAIRHRKFGVAIGEVVVGNTKTLLGMAQHYEYLVGFHFKRAHHVMDSAFIFPGALTMFRSDILRQVGEFTNYSSTEDLDISMRIKSLGVKVAYVDRAICVTEGASTLRGLINQRTRWRHGFIECMLARKEFVFGRQKGKYLTFVDLPLSIIGVIEILLLPIFVAFVVLQLVHLANPLILLLSYLLLPMVVLLLGEIREHDRPPLGALALMPVLALITNLVEYVALCKALYRTVRRKRTAWTSWQRQGIP